ncbi:MAG: hypothetical protein LKJ66_09295 [Clostridium luticellarii]|jgi:hypothetical protein|uniref:Uncharacterized protein n=1 Tax=Clostridium luticellarii TaxID=1691940 RepID=A0A2T0BQL4_9CLOT|nr:hypothetical protein [Clostridium luticellarii]MCI1995664.1 hypothetical protein [Clostridium luticellarii]MCI2040256.1 hypothetical protein [Clostridium luticellarii]PRR86174.1 hypothetical protein CLLU_08240 [Clostridium luticellarii]
MDDLEIGTVKVISSLPGRIRVNVKGLLGSKEMALKIKGELTGYNSILSSGVSKNTGNVLIYYNSAEISEDKIVTAVEKAFNSPRTAAVENKDNSSLLKMFIDALNPLFLFKRKHSEKVYGNEYGISSKILRASIGISAGILLFTGNAANAISVFILGYPGIIFAVSAFTYYCSRVKLNMKKIYMKNNTSLSFLNSIDTFLIEDDVFRNEFNEHSIDLLDLNKYDVQKMVILGKLNDPVSSSMKLIINDIRTLGISNIFIIGNNEDRIIQYIAYVLGIKILDRDDLERENNCLMTDKYDSSNTILVTTDKSLENRSKYLSSNCTICLYRDNNLTGLKEDINLEYSNIDKLPSLIKLSYFCSEINTQTENTAITLNILGMLFAVLNYLTPLYSVIYYILNTLFMTLILKLRFNSCKNFDEIPRIKFNYLTD